MHISARCGEVGFYKNFLELMRGGDLTILVGQQGETTVNFAVVAGSGFDTPWPSSGAHGALPRLVLCPV